MAPAGQGLRLHLGGVQDRDQPEPGSRQPRRTAWPPPSSLPAWRGTQPSRRVPGQAGRGVGRSGCIQLGFTTCRPRERPCGPSPGEPGPGKSPAAGARRPPGTGHRGSCKGAFTLGRKAGVWGSPAPPAPGHPHPASRTPGAILPAAEQGTVPAGDRPCFPSQQEPDTRLPAQERSPLCPETC